MTEKKSLVEEAIIQMKNLEEAVAENAKGILASTMRQEIKELVKESLKEEDDEEVEDEGDEMEMEDDEMEMDMDDEEMDMDMEDDDMEMDEPDMEDETIDLTNEPTSEVLRVFKLLTPEDEIVVTKDGSGNISLKDKQTDKEYMIVSEGYDDQEDFEMNSMYEMDDELMEMDFDVEDVFNDEFNMDEEINTQLFEMDDFEFTLDTEEEEEEESEIDEVIYELEVEEEDSMDFEEPPMMESKKAFKAKGMKFGNAQSYTMSKTPNMDGGFPVVKKGKADTMMGTGSAKKVKLYKSDSPSLDGDFNKKPTHKKERSEGMKKMETKEASRTNSYVTSGKVGLRKSANRYEDRTKVRMKESFEFQEVELLKEKNEEYRKALNIFRNKLNEVAIFNSNLAYATRLFTEHSTSKQEKINILKRFDGVETLKESKNLYKVIKDELSSSMPQQVNESVERVISKTPSTGSAINLIESKTYENPQFQRMKDLMGKLK